MKQYRFRIADYIVNYDKVLVNFINNLDIESSANIEYNDYIIKDSDTVEQIAFKLYGDSSLSWLILWLNNKIDPFFDWPLTTNELKKYLNNKYGDQIDEIHHYEINGKVVNKSSEAKGITNREYEENINNKKRNIKLPTIESMSVIINAIQ